MHRATSRRFTLLAVGLTGCATLAPTNSLPDGRIAQQHLWDADSARVKIVINSPGGITTGGGVWLGNGQVLTAMHLFQTSKDSDTIDVFVRGEKLAAVPALGGDLQDNDLALLIVPPASVPETLRSLPMPQICRRKEQVGEHLYVVAYDRTYSTYASPDGQTTYQGKTWSRATTEIFSHGVSGSAVYDEDRGCLAGIISRSEFEPSLNSGTRMGDACVEATRDLLQGPPDITCAFVERTVFSSSDHIASFLADAQLAFKKSPPPK